MFKPNLGGKFDPDKVLLPGMISPKLDGVRCLVMNGVAMTRKMLTVPNRHIQRMFASGECNGLDGELGVGSPVAPDFYRRTNSAVMSHGGEPDFTFYVFDRWDMQQAPFFMRQSEIPHGLPLFTKVLEQRQISSLEEINQAEQDFVDAGYEGAIYRVMNGRYKQGRSTTNEGGLLKIKRFADAEAEIIGVEEKMRNDNPAKFDAMGYTKRSSHAENKFPLGVMGALRCRGTTAFHGIEFNIGSGFNDADREWFWINRRLVIGRQVKFKYFEVGIKDAPRHPIFLGLRDD